MDAGLDCGGMGGGDPIHMLTLRNGHVTCPCCLEIFMFPVEFKKKSCRMSL